MKTGIERNTDLEPGSITVVWYLRTPGFVQFMAPLYRGVCERRGDIRHILAVDYPMDEYLSDFDPPPAAVLSQSEIEDDPSVTLYITGQFQGKAHRDAVFLNIGHGFYTKMNAWRDEDLERTDILFCRGPIEREMFEKTFSGRPSAAGIRIENVGHWKYDDLFGGRYSRDDILSGLGLDPSMPAVIYAPAWDPNASLRKYGERVAEALLSIDGINLIVKLHQASLEPPNSPYYESLTGGIDWRARFAPFASEPRFRFIDEMYINPYLAAADLMVSDISGVSMTFLALDKPVIQIDCPEFLEKTLEAWGQDPEETISNLQLSAGRSLCGVVGSPGDLPDEVLRRLENPGEGSEARRNFADRLLYNRGRATEVAVGKVLGLLTV